jgi:hypothetical protein
MKKAICKINFFFVNYIDFSAGYHRAEKRPIIVPLPVTKNKIKETAET